MVSNILLVFKNYKQDAIFSMKWRTVYIKLICIYYTHIYIYQQWHVVTGSTDAAHGLTLWALCAYDEREAEEECIWPEIYTRWRRSFGFILVVHTDEPSTIICVVSRVELNSGASSSQVWCKLLVLKSHVTLWTKNHVGRMVMTNTKRRKTVRSDREKLEVLKTNRQHGS